MGLFDTIHLPQPVACATCRADITSTQSKAFDPLQNDFQIGDCVGHAEEIRIVREDLYCTTCRTGGDQFVYLVVYRGILVGVAADLAEAESLLRTFSFEQLILWYHDLFTKWERERAERQSLTHFLHEVWRWFDARYDQMSPEELWPKRLFFIQSGAILEAADTPLAAIRAYLEQMEEKKDG